MKQLAVIFLLITSLGCKEQAKPELAVLNSKNSPAEQEVGISKNVLRYVKFDTESIALTNARLFDGSGGHVKEGQTIIVTSGYFQTIGKTSEVNIPENATVLDLKGKTVIPGLVGVHNHLHIPGFPFLGEAASKLYLASGVTTIQTCGAASPEEEVELSKKIKEGKIIGPNIVTSGPYFTGKGGNPNMIVPRSEKHVRDTMRYWTNRGVRWFKVYRNTRPEDLAMIVKEAQKQNARVTGHLCATTFEEASKLGIDGIEHGFSSMSDFRENKSYGECDGSMAYQNTLDIASDKVKRLQQLMIDENVFMTSTLAIYESGMPNRAFADDRTLNILSPFLVAQYEERRKRFDSLVKMGRSKQKNLKKRMQYEYQFFKMGGNLTAGVDPGRHVLPGFGDQRNFELLKEAGFTTAETVKIMTANGAKALSDSQIGTITKGKKADFIIIDGKIEDGIRNVETVFKDGYGYDPNLILREMKGKFGLPPVRGQ